MIPTVQPRAARAAFAWAILGVLAAPAHAQAPRPAPAPSDLLKYQCRMMENTECACSPGRGKPAVPYTQLLSLLATQSARVANPRDAHSRQIDWRRECGLLDGEDVP